MHTGIRRHTVTPHRPNSSMNHHRRAVLVSCFRVSLRRVRRVRDWKSLPPLNCDKLSGLTTSRPTPSPFGSCAGPCGFGKRGVCGGPRRSQSYLLGFSVGSHFKPRHSQLASTCWNLPLAARLFSEASKLPITLTSTVLSDGRLAGYSPAHSGW